MSMRRTKLGYVLYFLVLTFGIIAAGGILGAITFPLVGALVGAEGTASQQAMSGARQLAFLAMIWAPGCGVVLCFHRIYRDRHPRENGS
ncbi:MAG: hypothetical protein ACREIA_07795 [Opitutaceae bacterium]